MSFNSLPSCLLASSIFPFLDFEEILGLRQLNALWLESTNSLTWEPVIYLSHRQQQHPNILQQWESYIKRAKSIQGDVDVTSGLKLLIIAHNRIQHVQFSCDQELSSDGDLATNDDPQRVRHPLEEGRRSLLEMDGNDTSLHSVLYHPDDLQNPDDLHFVDIESLRMLQFHQLQTLSLDGSGCLSLLIRLASFALEDEEEKGKGVGIITDRTTTKSKQCDNNNSNSNSPPSTSAICLFPALTHFTIYTTSTHFSAIGFSKVLLLMPNLQYLDIKCPITQSHRSIWQSVFTHLSTPLHLNSFHFPLCSQQVGEFSQFGFNNNLHSQRIRIDFCADLESLNSIIEDVLTAFGTSTMLDIQHLRISFPSDRIALQQMAQEFQSISNFVTIQICQICFPLYGIPSYLHPNALLCLKPLARPSPTSHTSSYPCVECLQSLSNHDSPINQSGSNLSSHHHTSHSYDQPPALFFFPGVRTIELSGFDPLAYPMHNFLLNSVRFPTTHSQSSNAAQVKVKVKLWRTSTSSTKTSPPRSSMECDSIATAFSNHPDLNRNISIDVDEFDRNAKQRFIEAFDRACPRVEVVGKKRYSS